MQVNDTETKSCNSEMLPFTAKWENNFVYCSSKNGECCDNTKILWNKYKHVQ